MQKLFPRPCCVWEQRPLQVSRPLPRLRVFSFANDKRLTPLAAIVRMATPSIHSLWTMFDPVIPPFASPVVAVSANTLMAESVFPISTLDISRMRPIRIGTTWVGTKTTAMMAHVSIIGGVPIPRVTFTDVPFVRMHFSKMSFWTSIATRSLSELSLPTIIWAVTNSVWIFVRRATVAHSPKDISFVTFSSMASATVAFIAVAFRSTLDTLLTEFGTNTTFTWMTIIPAIRDTIHVLETTPFPAISVVVAFISMVSMAFISTFTTALTFVCGSAKRMKNREIIMRKRD